MLNETMSETKLGNTGSLIKEILVTDPQHNVDEISPDLVIRIQSAIKHRTGPMSFEEAIRQGYL